VGENHGYGGELYGRLENVTGMDDALIDGAHGDDLVMDDAAVRIQIEDAELFARKGMHVGEIFMDILGVLDSDESGSRLVEGAAGELACGDDLASLHQRNIELLGQLFGVALGEDVALAVIGDYPAGHLQHVLLGSARNEKKRGQFPRSEAFGTGREQLFARLVL